MGISDFGQSPINAQLKEVAQRACWREASFLMFQMEGVSDLAERLTVRNAGRVFVADDFAGWLIGLLANAGRKKLTDMVLGSEQERALRAAATAAIQRTAAELQPGNAKRAEHLAMVVSQAFGEPFSGEPLPGHATVLEALQAGIARQLAVLDDASLTETGQSSAEVSGFSGAVVAAKLTGHLLREIVGRGSRGGPLVPLADQLNHDETHLRGQRIEAGLGQLIGELRDAQSSMGRIHAAAPVALAQLPAAAAGFTGRETDLALLEELLNPLGSEGPVLVSAVAGLPGVGKTALAVQAAHAALRKGWYEGGVVFIDLHGYDDQPVEPGQALDALLRALGVRGDHIPAGVDERVSLYRSVLAQMSDPVLVVADNASSEAQVGPLLPGIGPHKMLVTSRHTLAGLNDARLVDVRILDEDSSAGLLDAALRTANPSDDRIARDPQAASRLAGLCDGLPLALRIAAALLKADPLFEANELADELAEEHQRLKRLHYDDGSRPGGLSVVAAFELSFRKLETDHARLFRLLPVNTGSDISVAPAAALADMPVGEVRHVLAGLVRAHLVEAAPGASRRWRMHDLIRLYAAQLPDDSAGPDSREQARDRLLRYYAGTTVAAVTHLVRPSVIRESEGFSGRDDALDWLDAERSNLVAAAGVSADLGYYLLAFGLCGALVDYLSWRRYIDDWIATATIGLRAARNLNDRSKEGIALDLLGLALQGTRQFDDAAKAHRSAAATFRETGDRRLEGRAMHNLGMALEELRRFGEAVIAYQQDLEICRESGDLSGAGITLNSLSTCLREENRLAEAVTASREAVTIHQATGDRRQEGMALNHLAASLQQMGELREGIAAGKEAVALLREARDKYMLGGALVTLCGLFQQTQFSDDAIASGQEAVAIFQEIGDRHAEGEALINLGGSFLTQMRFGDAIEAFKRAIVIFHETGDRHHEGAAFYNCGVALSRSRRFDEAISAYRLADAAFRETGDGNNRGRVLLSLGMAQLETGYFDEMLEACSAAAAIFRQVGDSLGEGNALNSLGIALMSTQKFKEAISVFRTALAIFRDAGDLESANKVLLNIRIATSSESG